MIIGGGFGGMYAARNLGNAPVDITLIDRRNFHLFQPLLYQVATGGLSPADISAPLRAIVRRQPNTRVLMAEVTRIDPHDRIVTTSVGDIPYDILVVATGVSHQYFGHDNWERYAPGLKTIEDALDIRRRIFQAFEEAELESDSERRRALMTFVIVGAGPTGVELAGAMAEIAFHALRRDFRKIRTDDARIVLVEGGGRVLPAFPDRLSKKAARSLHKLGVEIMTGTKVVDVAGDSVTIETPERSTLPTRTILWAAGVQASPLARDLAEDNPSLLDRAGRISVEPDLTVSGHPNVYVLGDLASFTHQTGQPLPGLAPVAIQQGQYVARAIKNRLAGKAVKPFSYFDKGSLATIGRHAAVGVIGPLKLSGLIAWLAWLFIHLMYLVGFDNRLLVFIQWMWNYVTRNRGARLITPEVVLSKENSAGKGTTIHTV